MSASVCSTLSRNSSRLVEDLDICTARKYPSVKDYYVASSSPGKPIQLQSGLTNYSGLQLGDDRLQFTESVMSATFANNSDKERPISPSKQQTKIGRQREYDAAKQIVTDFDLDHLERVMKNKLVQRSAHVSSPFQIRKALKFFDAEKSGFISVEDFAHALEFLGFQFTDVQNKALFARYDTDCSGGIDYMEFINKAMFEDSSQQNSTKQTKGMSPVKNKQRSNERPDFDSNELGTMQQAELTRVFALVNRKSPSNAVSRAELDLLLLTLLGYELTASAVDGCLSELRILNVKLGCNAQFGANVSIPLDLFLHWWTKTTPAHLESRLSKK